MPISIANAAFCSPAEALHTRMMYSTAEWLQNCRLEKCLVQHWAIFPPSISLYFTFECTIVLCWYHSVTLYPQSFIAGTERCPSGCGVVAKHKVLCSVWGGLEWEGCGKPQLLPSNKSTPGLSITLLTSCQERAWPEAALTEPAANSPVTWVCFYWQSWGLSYLLCQVKCSDLPHQSCMDSSPRAIAASPVCVHHTGGSSLLQIGEIFNFPFCALWLSS